MPIETDRKELEHARTAQKKQSARFILENTARSARSASPGWSIATSGVAIGLPWPKSMRLFLNPERETSAG